MSITTTLYRPYVWSPVYNDIVFQVQSNQTSQIDFKYVFDVILQPAYISGLGATPSGGTNSARFEARPLPDGSGLLNISSFLRGYIDNAVGWIEQAHTSTGSTTLDATHGAPFVGEVYVRVGEVYRSATGSALTMYNGFGNTASSVGNPAYHIYAQADGKLATISGTAAGSGLPVRYYNGYKNPEDFYKFIDNPTLTDYPYSLQVGTPSTRFGLFRTRLPGTPGDNIGGRTIYQLPGDKCSLTWWNRLDRWNIPDGQHYVWGARYRYYDAANNLVATDTINMTFSTFNNLGPFTTCASIAGLTWSGYNIGQISCGAGDRIVSNRLAITPGITYYTLRLYAPDNPTICLFTQQVSEMITFRFEAQEGLDYPRWRFSWLNDLGGRDWFNFVKQNKEMYNQSRQTYYRDPFYYSGDKFGALSARPSTFGEVVFNMNIQQKFQATTGWITEEQSVFLKGLFNSPHILAYPPSDVDDPDIPRLVVIETTSYEVMNYKRAKMFNYTIDFRFSQPLYTQTS